MKNSLVPLKETAFLAVGELFVSTITVMIFVLIGKFDYTVITGAVFGTLVVVVNFMVMSICVNRAVDSFLAARGNSEMEESEAEKFAAENAARIQNIVKISFIVRTLSMLAALVLAFVIDWFNVVSTVVPLLLFRPILTVESIIRKRRAR